MNRQQDTASPRPDHSLYRDVYQRLRSEILAGRLAAGARLPSSRTLASQLGVARGTVEVAYQMLAGEGYTIAAGARGTMVNPALSLRRRARPAESWARGTTSETSLVPLTAAGSSPTGFSTAVPAWTSGTP